MLERKPWKRPRKGKKIPREKTDRDQSEPLLLFSFQLQWTPATQNLPGEPLAARPAPRRRAGCWGSGGAQGSTQFHTAASAAPDARRARHSRASLAWAYRHKLASKETQGTHTGRARGARDQRDPHGKFFTANRLCELCAAIPLRRNTFEVL